MKLVPLLVLVSAVGCASAPSVTSGTVADGGSGGVGGGGGSAGAGGDVGGTGGTGGAALAGSGGAAGDGGSGGSAAGQAGTGGTPGMPIMTGPEQWTWVPVEGAVCADGSATGFGVNLTQQSDDLVVVLEGGGACWDASTCWDVGSSFNVMSGYGAPQFAGEVQLGQWMFSRVDPTNPFAKASFAYVPYCTGDIHGGTRVVDYKTLDKGVKTTHHVGALNVGLYLARLRATLPQTKRIWLVGSSAGGYGAALNWNQTQAIFPDVRVDVIDDSGPPIVPDPLFHVWRDAWNLSFPADCTGCGDSIGNLIAYDAQHFPQSRFGLVSFTADIVIPAFLGMSAMEFATRLDAFGASLDAYPSFKYFYVSAAGHTMLLSPTAPLETAKLTPLSTWVTQMKTDDPKWASEK